MVWSGKSEPGKVGQGVVRRKLRAFLGQSRFVQAWFLPVWLALGLSRGAIRILSFRRLAPLLGHDDGTLPRSLAAGARDEARALEIGRVVRMAATYTPWTSDCYPQAIVARGLMGLYGVPYTLYFGVRRGRDGLMQAHAWTCCGRIRVSGGAGSDRFTVVRQYTAAGPGRARDSGAARPS